MRNVKRFPVLISFLVILFLAACSEDSNNEEMGKVDNSEGLDSSVTLKILDAGGTSGDTVQYAYVDPFTEKTGIKVIRENPSTFGKLQSMVKAGDTSYNLVELSSSNLELANSMGLLEELDWDLINPDPILEEAKKPYGLGYQIFSTVMAWNPEATDGKDLESWTDFWDVEKFPGRRSMPDYPNWVLPAALLADGVPPEELFPLDLDRAFASLDKIKDHVDIWWESGAQPWQALIDGEVDYVIMWPSHAINNMDMGMKFTYNQALLDMTNFAVPKGATKNSKETMALLHEFTKVENAGKALEKVPSPGTTLNLEPLIPEKYKGYIATTDGNLQKHVPNDGKWWAENSEEVTKRWQQFKLSR
ncbi:extracellular solute-binding protein [Sporosarcina sp. 179-K 3D1 HS]|uniref:extracellular solute-binding protein n=1 Tax=Sporosarcina sp. 179-K 3D1 HS TaxID=3232169 RepID=UPI0039A1D20A